MPIKQLAFIAAIALASSLSAQTSEVQTAQIRAAAAEIQDRVAEQSQPLAEGETRVLQAIVMRTEGRVQWRPDAEAAWNTAKVDDLLDPGASIRTGRRSSLVLRVGKNATVLIDRNSRVVLPEIVQVGSTLTTRAQVKVGRAEVKVDKIGLENDFEVMTPSATLAVRGTSLAVQYGGLRGTQLYGARENALAAIEISYFLSRMAYVLSGSALSQEGSRENPAVAAFFETVGTPPLIAAFTEADETWTDVTTMLARTPVTDQREIDIAEDNLMSILDDFDDGDNGFPGDGEFPFGDVFGDGDNAAIAALLCESIFQIFFAWDEYLVADFGGGGDGEFSFPGLDSLLFQEIDPLCEDIDNETLIEMVTAIVSYCEQQFESPHDVELCITDFTDAVVDVFTPE